MVLMERNNYDCDELTK